MRKTNKQSGSTLLLTMLVMLVAFALAVSLLLAAQTSSHMSASRTNGELAFRVAEAGVQQATMSLKENNAYSGEQNTQFGGGNFTVTVTAPVGQATHRMVVSTGRAGYAEGLLATRSISAMIDLGTPPPIANFGIVSQSSLTLKGTTDVDSSPSGGQGNIASNGSITLNGTVNVDGSASSASTVTTTGGATVSGSINQDTAPVPFPTLDFPALKSQATATKITIGNVTVSGPAPVTLSGLINGDLNLLGSGHVTLQSPVWVTGKISFGGTGQIDGGALISEQDITASGQNSLSGTLELVTLGNFTLTGGASVNAAIFVPNGTFSSSGTSSVFGSVAAHSINLAGTTSITHNTGFKWSQEFAPTHLGFYQE